MAQLNLPIQGCHEKDFSERDRRKTNDFLQSIFSNESHQQSVSINLLCIKSNIMCATVISFFREQILADFLQYFFKRTHTRLYLRSFIKKKKKIEKL